MDTFGALPQQNGSAENVDALLETIRSEGAQRRNSTRWIKSLMALVFGVWIIEIVVDLFRGKPVDFADLIIFGTIFGGSCVYGLTPGLKKAVTAAASLSDKRFLGAMIEALDAGDPKLKDTLETSAEALLQQVGPADIKLLDEFQLDQLVKALRISKNIEFCVAALRALGCIGTNRTLQNLEVMLNDPFIPSKHRSRLEPHVRSAMAELRIRLAKERYSRPEITAESSLQSKIEKLGQTVSRVGQELSVPFNPPIESD